MTIPLITRLNYCNRSNFPQIFLSFLHKISQNFVSPNFHSTLSPLTALISLSPPTSTVELSPATTALPFHLHHPLLPLLPPPPS